MFFSKLLLLVCANRPQERHFLVVIKKVYQPPGTVSWNRRNERARVGRRGPSVSTFNFVSVNQSRGANYTGGPPPTGDSYRRFHQVGFRQGRPSHPRGQRARASRAPHPALPQQAPGRSPGLQTKPGELLGALPTHRHPRKTWLAQAMEKETSCCSCRSRVALSASAASSALVEAASPVGARSPALRSRNSRR